MSAHSDLFKATNGGAPIGTPVPVAVTATASAAIPPRPTVDPHSLVHKQKLSKPLRALLGAELLDGRIPLTNPTVAMVAQATGVSAAYIAAARRLSPEARREVAWGMRPLVRKTK